MTQAQKETMYWNSKHESHQNRIAITSEPYAWPGGYPKYAIWQSTTHGGDTGVICAKCCADTELFISAIDINWEDPELYCDECNAQIECAYE